MSRRVYVHGKARRIFFNPSTGQKTWVSVGGYYRRKPRRRRMKIYRMRR